MTDYMANEAATKADNAARRALENGRPAAITDLVIAMARMAEYHAARSDALWNVRESFGYTYRESDAASNATVAHYRTAQAFAAEAVALADNLPHRGNDRTGAARHVEAMRLDSIACDILLEMI